MISSVCIRNNEGLKVLGCPAKNHRAHLEKLVEYCDIGVKEGARLLLGGKQCDRPGLYMEPTIFADVEDGTFIAIEESFGPVMV